MGGVLVFHEMSAGDWLVPELGLETKLLMERDVRAAKASDRPALERLTEKLIRQWYDSAAQVQSLLKRVRELELERLKKEPADPDLGLGARLCQRLLAETTDPILWTRLVAAVTAEQPDA